MGCESERVVIDCHMHVSDVCFWFGTYFGEEDLMRRGR